MFDTPDLNQRVNVMTFLHPIYHDDNYSLVCCLSIVCIASTHRCAPNIAVHTHQNIIIIIWCHTLVSALMTSCLHSLRFAALLLASLMEMFLHHFLMLSLHFVLCLPLLLFPSIFPSRMMFSRPSDLLICPKYFNFCRFTAVRKVLRSFTACKIQSLLL